MNTAMYLVIWTQLFLEAQGFKVVDNIVHQDNQSAMLLKRNGKTLSSKKTRHIDIRYYFVTDHVARGKMSLAYCPTDAMVADYFTKPLQGTTFRKFQAMIMNYQDPALALMSQECVGASPLEVNPEEKDSLHSGLANSTRETSAQVQLGLGTQNPKDLPNKASFMGGSKECMKNSITDKNDVVNEGYTCCMFKQDPIDGS